MKAKATIKDVAKLAGVSFKTVSRVINREPSVGEAMQQKVWKAIEELDYQPNLSARQLRGSASFIAFIYDNPNSHYVIEMQHGILKECQSNGFELLIHPVDATGEGLVDELLKVASNSHIAGLILTPPFSESEEVVSILAERGVKFTRIISGDRDPDQYGPKVFIDDYRAAYKITQYLIGLGHRRIAFLGGEEEHLSSVTRMQGYKAALEANNVSPEDGLVLPGEYNFDSGTDRTRSLLTLDPPPTAIFACNDEIAAGALFAARIQQVPVPQQLSIIGFEDSPFSRQSWPKLTTAHQPNPEIAETATRLLIDLVRASRQGTDNQVADQGFQPQLIVRDSTCPR
ncbi:LacI family transcriptional regulator [Halioglobus sp. HI00S01]|uniref:LacI family DNA-binding transcriptional regulator n=1 Tax=Halioglobus sp. HI00S01 TaxID=1822214 RepID=UPI0007C1FDF9|nr:LacI family DNA-binding transcriptional regulator [Halioglobus sp. HI00S01]KZX54965.1 LacI family transcriptional regulator [Halioglobus sp. HI00S01]